MSRCAAVGRYESICGFLAAGMEIFPVEDAPSCVTAVKNVTESDFGALFLTEEFAYLPEIKALIQTPVPAVLVVPDATGSRHLAQKELHEMVEKAAGADLLGGNE